MITFIILCIVVYFSVILIDLFYHKEGLNIKKKDGVIFEVMPQNIQKHGKI